MPASQLEAEAKEVILAMLSDEPFILSVREQKKIARWATLKVIVLDHGIPRDAVVGRRDCFALGAKGSYTVYRVADTSKQ